MTGIHCITFKFTVFILFLELPAAFSDVEKEPTGTTGNCRLEALTAGIDRIGIGIENIVEKVGGNGDTWDSAGKSKCCHLFPEYKKELNNIKIRLGKLEEKCKERYPASCAEIQERGSKKDGVYRILPHSSLIKKPIYVYCDLTTVGGGWTVFQKRDDNGNPKDYFLRKWKDYKEGFGDPEKDYWLGNDNLYALTNQEKVELRFDLWDWKENHRYASAKSFRITEPKTYTMSWSGFSGDAGNSLPHTGTRFSTIDADHDTWVLNCAKRYKGAWWYTDCHSSNLNGIYKSTAYAEGLTWGTWKKFYYSLKKTEIKIRPRYFKKH